MKRERFFAHVYFANETVSQTTVSTGPMKMFRLEHETKKKLEQKFIFLKYREESLKFAEITLIVNLKLFSTDHLP